MIFCTVRYYMLLDRISQEFSYINYPESSWVEPSPFSYDVVIIGAGMAGISAAFALKRLGISNIGIFDRSVDGYEGPWATYARMPHLRSGKNLTGPALDFPLLTFRAWYEAQGGIWSELVKIPTNQWMDYLRWLRKVLDLPVQNGRILHKILPQKEGLKLLINDEEITTAKVVLATGRDGFGGIKIPRFVSGLPKEVFAHTNDPIDFAVLKDKKVGVAGGGASGFDAAAAALEAGSCVDMILRKDALPFVNKAASLTYSGFSEGYYRLNDQERWKLMEVCYRNGVPPPHESVERIINHPKFTIIRGTPIQKASWVSSKVRLDTPHGELSYDFLILATGFEIDGKKQKQLELIIDEIELWGDRMGENLGPDWFYKSPYLGEHFQFLGKASYLKDIYCFNYAATLSHGLLSGDIPGIGVGASRLARGIASDLFGERWEAYYRRLADYQEPELMPDLR